MRPMLALLWLCAGCAPADPEPESVSLLATRAVAERLAHEGLERQPPERRALDWIDTVFGHSLLKLDERAEDDTWRQATERWLGHYLDEFSEDPPRTFHSSDSMSPASAASLLQARMPELDLHPLLAAAHEYLDGANRTAEGAITHWSRPSSFLPDDEIWVDSLFMFGMFWLAEHARTGERVHMDHFVEQYLLFSDLCRDPTTQLYAHAYKDSTGQNIPTDSSFWARGNSWVLVAGAQALSQLDPGDAAYEELAPRVRSHAEAVLWTQAEDGLWHTVMNQPRGPDPRNYTETSGSALLAYGLVRAAETVLDPEEVLPAVSRTIRGIEARIDEGPEGKLVLRGTSFGTNPGPYEDYVSVDVGRNLPLGTASVILLWAQADGMEER